MCFKSVGLNLQFYKYMYVAHMLFDRNMTLMFPFICNGSNSMEILLYQLSVHGQYIATIFGHTATGQLLYHVEKICNVAVMGSIYWAH